MDPLDQHPIILFDGFCHLCNATVTFLLKHDRRHVLRFASLQSAAGARLMETCAKGSVLPDSVILIYKGECFTRSEAVLQAMRFLPAPWRWLAVFRIVPRPVRDWLYDGIARNRYRWFGRREQCRLPEPEERDRFLE